MATIGLGWRLVMLVHCLALLKLTTSNLMPQVSTRRMARGSAGTVAPSASSVSRFGADLSHLVLRLRAEDIDSRTRK